MKRGCLLVKTPEQGSKVSGIDKTLGSCSPACFLFVDAAHGGWQGFATSHRVEHRTTSNIARHRTLVASDISRIGHRIASDISRIGHRIASDISRIGHRIVIASKEISTSLQLVTEVVNPLRHSGVHGRAIQHNVGRQQKWRTDGWSSIVGCHHKIHGIANNSCWQEQRASRTRMGASTCAYVRAWAHMRACTRGCKRACMRARMGAGARACVHAWVRARVHVYAHGCKHPCMRARMNTSTYAYVHAVPFCPTIANFMGEYDLYFRNLHQYLYL